MTDLQGSQTLLTEEHGNAEAFIVALLQRIDERLAKLEELVGKYEPMIARYGNGKWGRYGR
jgi:hypothetical protein